MKMVPLGLLLNKVGIDVNQPMQETCYMIQGLGNTYLKNGGMGSW